MTPYHDLQVTTKNAAALLQFLRRVQTSDLQQTLGSPAEVVQLNAGLTRCVWR
jgi:hypothetical protein